MSHSCSGSRTHTLTHTLTDTHTHTLSHTLTHSLDLQLLSQQAGSGKRHRTVAQDLVDGVHENQFCHRLPVKSGLTGHLQPDGDEGTERFKLISSKSN